MVLSGHGASLPLSLGVSQLRCALHLCFQWPGADGTRTGAPGCRPGLSPPPRAAPAEEPWGDLMTLRILGGAQGGGFTGRAGRGRGHRCAGRRAGLRQGCPSGLTSGLRPASRHQPVLAARGSAGRPGLGAPWSSSFVGSRPATHTVPITWFGSHASKHTVPLTWLGSHGPAHTVPLTGFGSHSSNHTVPLTRSGSPGSDRSDGRGPEGGKTRPPPPGLASSQLRRGERGECGGQAWASPPRSDSRLAPARAAEWRRRPRGHLPPPLGSRSAPQPRSRPRRSRGCGPSAGEDGVGEDGSGCGGSGRRGRRPGQGAGRRAPGRARCAEGETAPCGNRCEGQGAARAVGGGEAAL